MIEKVFQKIYDNNKWQNEESRSGSGSTLKYTENLRNELPKIINQFEIKSILDAPCGDFNWMKKILPKLNVDYIGGDIVPTLIKINSSNYSSTNVKFIPLDITKDKLPNTDLMICRDCLFHLSYEYINNFFKNFAKSNIKYLLTSTHINNGFKNRNIKVGAFRPIDLFLEPFNLPNSVLYRFDDWIEPSIPREMVLFDIDTIRKSVL